MLWLATDESVSGLQERPQIVRKLGTLNLRLQWTEMAMNCEQNGDGERLLDLMHEKLKYLTTLESDPDCSNYIAPTLVAGVETTNDTKSFMTTILL